MHKPAKNRQAGGIPPPKITGSAGKVMGKGKPINGGTAYAPKDRGGLGGATSVMHKGPYGTSSRTK